MKNRIDGNLNLRIPNIDANALINHIPNIAISMWIGLYIRTY